MISVVIVTHNSAACVGPCLEELERCLPGAEILVIDNASIDATRTIAGSQRATVVGLGDNLGYGRAGNVGARRAAGAHILFLNPDVAIRSADVDELRKLVHTVELGLVVPSSESGGFAIGERSWIREALSFTFGTLRPRELPQRLPPPRGGQVVWASGAALLVRRSEFLAVGGFDPRYFLYYEDRDLSWRYRQAGLPVRVTAGLFADHVAGGSSDIGDRRSDIIAFAMMGWLQYTTTVLGPTTAARRWKLVYAAHAAIVRIVKLASRVVPSSRLRRKSLQLCEVTRELTRIRMCSGVLAQSDGCAYWTDALALMNSDTQEHATR